MNRATTYLIPAVLILLAAGAPRAQASGTQLENFDFTGTCETACTGEATAVLTLENYTLGSQLAESNFVEFSYSAPDSLFDLDTTDLTGTFISGILPTSLATGPAPANVFLDLEVTVDDTPFEFLFNSGTDNAGPDSWSLVNNGVIGDDNGVDGIWTLAPEPGSVLLFGIGLIAIGCTSRRRASACLARIRRNS